MNGFISKFAVAFQQHVGRDKAIKTCTVADAVQVSDDTVRRIALGETEAGAEFLSLLAKKFGSTHPEMIYDLSAVIFAPAGFKLVRDEQFSKDELDANHDGRVDRTDAMLHQSDASKASLEKSDAIIHGDNFQAVGRIDPLVTEACAKASAALRIANY